jgi:hypothetical protein
MWPTSSWRLASPRLGRDDGFGNDGCVALEKLLGLADAAEPVDGWARDDPNCLGPMVIQHPLPLVAFDETGNTGQHLLDVDQPVFVLASIHADDATTRTLLAHAKPPGAPEAKFSTLRGSNPGRKRVLELLNHEVIASERVKVAVYHKSFAVTTKIVDLLVETLLHQAGQDLYADGANLAMANMLHAVTPAFCGAEAFVDLQHRFVAMVRRKSPATVEALYAHVEAMRATNCHPPFDETLRLLLASRAVVDEAIKDKDLVLLDPAVPAFFDLCAQWTAELGVPFAVAHDQSKPIAQERERLELVMTTAEAGRAFSGPGPRRQLPLLATGVTFADSRAVPQIQLADLIAGAVATVYRAMARGQDDRFAEALRKTRIGEIAGDRVWPTTAVTPAEYGAGRSGAALDYTVALAARERARRFG